MKASKVTRADIEALCAWGARGFAGPKPALPKDEPAAARFTDINHGEAWRGLSPASQRAYRRLRLIEKRARAGNGRLTDTDCEWMASDKGETPEDRAERLRLMYAERPRITVSPEWRAAMNANSGESATTSSAMNEGA